jgi:hypothetical protein
VADFLQTQAFMFPGLNKAAAAVVCNEHFAAIHCSTQSSAQHRQCAQSSSTWGVAAVSAAA